MSERHSPLIEAGVEALAKFQAEHGQNDWNEFPGLAAIDAIGVTVVVDAVFAYLARPDVMERRVEAMTVARLTHPADHGYRQAMLRAADEAARSSSD